MSKKQSIYNKVVLGFQVWVLLALAGFGLYRLLQMHFGDTFVWVPIIGILAWVALIVERYLYVKREK